MKAFTFIGNKINISLLNDTLTIYNNNPPISVFDYSELDLFLDSPFIKEMGVMRYIHNHDQNHYKYHQDNFHEQKTHWHLQFPKTLSLRELTSIVNVFVDHNFLSVEESTKFLEAYSLLPTTFMKAVKNYLNTEKKSSGKEGQPLNKLFFLQRDRNTPLKDITNQTSIRNKNWFFNAENHRKIDFKIKTKKSKQFGMKSSPESENCQASNKQRVFQTQFI